MRKSLIGPLATLLIFGSLAGSASAASISLSFSSDPTEEVPVQVTATWSPASGSTSAYVTVKPAGATGCAPTYAADSPNSDDVIYDGNSSPRSVNRTFEDPGSYVFCGYLTDVSTSQQTTIATTGPVTVNVRSATASIALTPPAQVDPSQVFTLAGTVTTELQRAVFVTIKPVGGRGCEANYQADSPVSTDVIYDLGVQGAQQISKSMTAPSTRGTYLLCAWVLEGSGDLAPEATTSAQFLVGPTPCQIARAAQERANGAVKVAENAVTKYRRAYKHDALKAAHTSGSARRHWRALYKRDRSRYRSAINRRAEKRAALVDANNAVAQACTVR